MGGGAMRTAAKAAALGGYRSPGLFSGSSRRAPRTFAVSPATVEGGPSVPVLSASEKNPQSEMSPLHSAQRPSWELDDWEFAGLSPGEEEYAADAASVEPPPRLVFGPVPTLEEAQEATSDLKFALEKVYCSSPASSNFGAGSKGHQDSVNDETLANVPSMPKQVVQAFSLLQSSPEALEVVASLASSKAVWDAVMSNEKVIEFCNSHLSEVSDAGNEHANWSSAESCESSTDESSKKSGFSGFMHKVKVKVEVMATNISNFLQDLLATSSPTSTKTSSIPDFAMGSFFALAIAIILVILFKRGA